MGEAGVFHVDDRVELIDGEIVDMTPIGSRHASVVARLSRSLTWAVGDAALVWTQNPVVLGETSETQPDVALLRPRADFYASGHPRPADVLLVIEVADTSIRYDREIKFALYARHGIPEAWLVDLGRAAIMAYRHPGEGRYRNVAPLDNLRCSHVPSLQGITVDLSACLTPL
jgi:Uma2 family endonuclease